MKRTLLVSAMALLLAFFTLTIWKQRRLSDHSGSEESSVADRQTLRDFWDHYHQATSLRNKDDFQTALVHYQKALSLDPRHEESLYYAGSCLMELGRYQEALKFYDRLVELNPESQRALMQLGQILSSGLPGAPPPDLERAALLYRKSSILNPEESGPFLRLGLLALKEKKPAQALGFLQTAAGFRSPEGIFLAGFAHYVRGEYAEADELFQKVLDIATQEARLSGKGFLFEGHSKAEQMPGPPFSPLQAAALKSMIFQFWAKNRLGKNPKSSAREFPVQAPRELARVVRVAQSATRQKDPSVLPRTATGFSSAAEQVRVRVVRFEPATPFLKVETGTGIEFEGEAVDVSRGDFDQDGRTDLFLLRWKRPAILFRSREDGTFEDKTADAGLSNVGGDGFSSLFFDFDKDGRLDLLVTRCASSTQVAWSLLNTERECALQSPQLFRGMSGGRFQEISGRVGLTRCYGTMQALAADVNGDGWTDLILANGGFDAGFLEPSVVLLNQRGKSFSEVFIPSYQMPGSPRGVGVSDVDGDGSLEIELPGLGVFRLRDQTGRLVRGHESRRTDF